MGREELKRIEPRSAPDLSASTVRSTPEWEGLHPADHGLIEREWLLPTAGSSLQAIAASPSLPWEAEMCGV